MQFKYSLSALRPLAAKRGSAERQLYLQAANKIAFPPFKLTFTKPFRKYFNAGRVGKGGGGGGDYNSSEV